MSEMRLVVVGAAGRMGRMLIKAVAETEGCVLVGAFVREGSPALGQDAGLLAGVGLLAVDVTDDPLPVFAQADGVLDFTAPAASAAFAALAAQARIVHVVGTTGFSPDDEAALRAAARHARIVKSGNMSLGVNLLAGLVRRAAAALGGATGPLAQALDVSSLREIERRQDGQSHHGSEPCVRPDLLDDLHGRRYEP